MALIDPHEVAIKDGTVTIRSATPDDAPGVVALSWHMTEWELSLTEPDEAAYDIETIANELKEIADDPQRLRLVAVEDGQIVGGLDFTAPPRRRIRHRGRFGIAIATDWRGYGIGSALIGAMLAWAREHPYIEKVRLHVLSANTRAIALYERLGFVEEARRRDEFRLVQRGLLRRCDDGAMGQGPISASGD